MVQKEPLENLYEECHRRFYYSDGELIRKITTSSRAKKGSSPTHINNSGYLMVCVNAKQYLVHRIIYLMHHGTLPDMIDHIDTQKHERPKAHSEVFSGFAAKPGPGQQNDTRDKQVRQA